MSLKDLILNSENGYFGSYGGRYVPEMLIPVVDTLAQAYEKAKEDQDFLRDLDDLYHNYSGRPTPLYFCKNISEHLGGGRIYLKNEGLNHTGAHKINHCLGQILLAKQLGKKRIIAETGAGQHGLATATVCAKMGLECVVYMGKKDYDRQRPNVFWMERLGAKVIPVFHGGQVLKDAINGALKAWLEDPENTHYLLGTVCGPHPYPAMNAFFQSIVGREVREQLQAYEGEGVLPDYLVACVGGGCNALGLFTEFLDDEGVKMVGVEAGGSGIKNTTSFKCTHAARMQTGKIGITEGFKSYFLQTEEGQIQETSSISAGIDYSGISPQLAYLSDINRVQFAYALDDEVLEAYKLLAKHEGILAALESSHALVEAFKLAPTLQKDESIVVNLSGRGDKDLFIMAPILDPEGFTEYLKTHVS